jgi:hypothetical protein
MRPGKITKDFPLPGGGVIRGAEEEPTQRVIFRVWRNDPQAGEVIALFPDQEEDNGLVGSYMHVGQHGAASPAIVNDGTRPAREEEYMPLLRELEQIGYRLTIRKRFTRKRG